MSRVINEGQTTIIQPGQDVVASMADGFKQELLSAIHGSQGELVIDLSGVEIVDSVGIGIIVAAHNTLNRSARKLKIINVTMDIFDLFTTMRLNRRFDIQAAG